MYKRSRILIIVFLLFAAVFSYGQTDSLFGDYRLKYEEKTNMKNKGWVNRREELLSLNKDSTFVLIRIQPQGTFEVMPDSGKWVLTRSNITLKFNKTNNRVFKVVSNGIKELDCKESWLSNLLWEREDSSKFMILGKVIESVDDIDFNKLEFVHQENLIDSVKYNCVYTCPQNMAKIYCNINKHGKKEGFVLVLDNEGDFFVMGEFKSNKKCGWWWYGGCCRTFYKRDKQKRTICALF